jgi:hypothetical protein
MKTYRYGLLSLLFSSLLFIGCASGKDYYVFTSFHEPANEGLRFLYSKDAIHWDSIPGIFLKPEVGKQPVLRDPSISRSPNGTYHLVWTCSWKGDRGFGYSSSRDLIHWTPEREIRVMADTSTVNVWAPELFYDDEQQQYMVVWSSCVPYKFKKGLEDERNNHRLYYTMTKNFQTFAPAKLLYDPGFSSIDATILKRGKEDYVMIFKDNTRLCRNLKVAFAKSPYGPWSEASKSFTEEYTEGPTTVKVGGQYYIYFDGYHRMIYGAMRTKDFHTFIDVTNEVEVPVGHKHGTIFRAPKNIVKRLINGVNKQKK